jgi:hypothetical protein
LLALALFVPALPFSVSPARVGAICTRSVDCSIAQASRFSQITIANRHIRPRTSSRSAEPRRLAGIDLDTQLALLEHSSSGKPCARSGARPRGRTFSTERVVRPRRAEALYSIIRHFKPRKIVEIGCGQSTLVAHFAIADVKAEDPNTGAGRSATSAQSVTGGPRCRGQREQINGGPRRVPFAVRGDIVFIDCRTQGHEDVEFEFLHILPILPKGRHRSRPRHFLAEDYRKWLKDERRFWNEQYLLEAFMSFNGIRDHLFRITCISDQPSSPRLSRFWQSAARIRLPALSGCAEKHGALT